MANSNRRTMRETAVESTDIRENPNDELETDTSTNERSTIDDQPLHSVRIVTTVGRIFEHRRVRHGFDEDDLVVLSSDRKTSYMYPKQNILSLVIIEEDNTS